MARRTSTVEYGDHPDQVADLTLPPGAATASSTRSSGAADHPGVRPSRTPIGARETGARDAGSSTLDVALLTTGGDIRTDEAGVLGWLGLRRLRSLWPIVAILASAVPVIWVRDLTSLDVTELSLSFGFAVYVQRSAVERRAHTVDLLEALSASQVLLAMRGPAMASAFDLTRADVADRRIAAAHDDLYINLEQLRDRVRVTLPRSPVMT